MVIGGGVRGGGERETDSKNRLKLDVEEKKMPRECCLVTFRASYHHKKFFVSDTHLP